MRCRRDTASSPCDVSHRASDEPCRRMSLSSALAPLSLASPSIRRVFLRSLCARRRSVSSLSRAAYPPERSGVAEGELNAGCGCRGVWRVGRDGNDRRLNVDMPNQARLKLDYGADEIAYPPTTKGRSREAGAMRGAHLHPALSSPSATPLRSGGYADRVKLADGTSASAKATKTNAPYGR